MKSDWYKTTQRETYLVVPAGTELSALDLPEHILSLVETPASSPIFEDVESHAKALSFNRAGIDDCLKHSGFCIIRG